VKQAEEQENSEPESSVDKTSSMSCKIDQKPNIEPFFGTTGLNIVIDNPESVVEVMRSIFGDNLILLFNEQSTFTIVKIRENGRSHLKH
jgi:hypothetical protein